jgi:predicted naringenin-chalcone synthase
LSKPSSSAINWGYVNAKLAPSKIVGIGIALPRRTYSQAEIFDELGYNRHFWPLFRDSGVERRGFAVPLGEIKRLTFQEQQERYRVEALRLSLKAAADCLDQLRAEELGLILSAHCTAFGFPGPTLAHAVGRELGCQPAVFYENLASLGCEGGIPGLKRAWDFHRHSRQPALLVICELSSCSYHPEPAGRADGENGYELLRSNVVFADAAAAILVASDEKPRHPFIRDMASYTDATLAGELGYVWRGGRLRVRLGKKVPELAAGLALKVVENLLSRNRLRATQIAHWVVHAAGGPILDGIQEGLELPDAALKFSRRVLKENGNCSAATIGLIGQHIMREGNPASGDFGLVVAVGPGMTAGAALLQWP